MTHQSQPIIVSIMGGQILALHEAIAAILAAHNGVLAGVLDGADLDEAIYAAVDLLPPEMRKDVLPSKKIKRAAGFDDLGI